MQFGGVEELGLAERIVKGDRIAEGELVHAFGQRIFALLCARTRDPEASRDLLQDVLIAVLMALRQGQLREADKLPAFVLSVARHKAQSYLRDRSRDTAEQLLDDEEGPPVQAASELFEIAEREALVRKALERLDSTDREILMRTLTQGQKPGAIAQALGLSPDAVRQRKSRAIKKMSDFCHKSVTIRGVSTT